MSHSKEHFDGKREFEIALRSIAPTAPARSAADIAFEAGRRDAISQQRQTLWIHRLATAAAILVAGMLGANALLDQDASAPRLADGTSARPLPAFHDQTGEGVPARAASPYSYLALRTAVMGGGEIDLGGLPAGPSGGPSDDPASVRSIGDALRKQRGL